MLVVLNGDIVPESAVQLSLNDRAVQYGDGLFETIRYERGQVWFWPDHFDRLTRGMKALSLTPPLRFEAEPLHRQIINILKFNNLTENTARIKLQVWRRPGGLYTPATDEAFFFISPRTGPPFAVTEKDSVEVFDAYRLFRSPVSAYKTINSLPYVLAGIAKRERKADDMILLDTQGHLAECIASNLFWVQGDTLFTPSPDTGCIEGVLRRQLLRLAPRHGLTVREGLFLPEVLGAADAVFCSNSAGIQWLRRVGGSEMGRRTERLEPVFRELLPA
ncbi:aminotransferase class IV [Larkinella soli]|uniref:aminotransferase class IV n=1 Tax=Larkinella soli TaxID=1770527 RepID=UPI0013E3E808|nr:aminotransferase class IV [Larkinella soli]